MQGAVQIASIVYGLASPLTYAVLLISDWQSTDSWGAFLLCALVFDAFLAAIWPIYWLILVPIFGM